MFLAVALRPFIIPGMLCWGSSNAAFELLHAQSVGVLGWMKIMHISHHPALCLDSVFRFSPRLVFR